jgi:pimeloyl-ACP methyl ester carboxylesterase
VKAGCVALASLALLWMVGSAWIRAREPELGASLPAGFPGRVIEVGRHDVRIVERGAGPPVLLVAGTGGSAANWPESVLAGLATTRRVVAVDLLGMGFSARDARLEYGFRLWSEQLVGVLDRLGIERASVVGHSLGGTVALFVAANFPARVDRIVLIGSAIWLPWWFPVLLVPGPGEMLLAAQDVFGPTFSSRHREQAVAAYRIRGSRQALLRYVRRSVFEAGTVLPAVDAVGVPVLQLHGTEDEEVPYSAAVRLRARLRDSRLVPIEGAGHFAMIDAPERLVSEVQAFLHAR